MAGLNHQACGVLDLASTARCPDRALLSKHSNQDEKPDLGQERDAHDRNRKEHVARRERVHECLAPSEAPGVNHSGEKMFRFQTQTARDASGTGIRGSLNSDIAPKSAKERRSRPRVVAWTQTLEETPTTAAPHGDAARLQYFALHPCDRKLSWIRHEVL